MNTDNILPLPALATEPGYDAWLYQRLHNAITNLDNGSAKLHSTKEAQLKLSQLRATRVNVQPTVRAA